MIGFVDAVKMFFRRYTDFQGRSARAEYWWVVLFQLLAYIIFGTLFIILGGGFEAIDGAIDGGGALPAGASIIGGIVLLFMLAVLIPNIALAVRRFHDLNQTGWLYLVFVIVGIIPLIGILASLGMIIWFCIRGTVGPNKYGEDPLGG